MADRTRVRAYHWSVGDRRKTAEILAACLEADTNQTIVVRLAGFEPQFFIELDPAHAAYCNDSFQQFQLASRAVGCRTDALVRWKVIYRHRFSGYSTKTYPFLRVHTRTIQSARYAGRNLLRDAAAYDSDPDNPFWPSSDFVDGVLGVWETNIDPLVALGARYGYKMAGWYQVTSRAMQRSELLPGGVRWVCCSLDEFSPVDDARVTCPLVFAFDIEVDSHDGRSFPSSKVRKDRIFLIGGYFRRLGVPASDDPDRKFIIWSLDAAVPPGHVASESERQHGDSEIELCIRHFDTETELLLDFVALLLQTPPNIMVGHNILGFDLPMILERSNEILNIDAAIRDSWTVLPDWYVTNRCMIWTSNARKLRFTYPETGHIAFFDTLPAIAKDYRLPSYSLENVGLHFLQRGKTGLKAAGKDGLFDLYRRREMRPLRDYLVQDVFLTWELFVKLDLWIGFCEFANVLCIPPMMYPLRGEMSKVFAQLYCILHERKIIVTQFPTTPRKRSYEGALVLEPTIGLHTYPVAVADFQSLYPSLIRAYNISPDAFLCDNADRASDDILVQWDRHHNCDHVPLSPRASDLSFACEEHRYRFVAPSRYVGCLPELVRNLMESRAQVRRQLADEHDPLRRQILDRRQLALKISANSVYGWLGNTFDQRAFVIGAACVTALGRQHLQSTEQWFIDRQYRVIYGDSVTGDTPVLLKKANAPFEIVRLDEIAGAWQPYAGDKEAFSFECDTWVWSDGGFTPARRLIRHRCEKPIIRVNTHTGLVDCTADHSLVALNGDAITPASASIGTLLLHQDDEWLLPFIHGDDLSVSSTDEAFLMGLFVADGTAGCFRKKSVWCINKNNLLLLERCRDIIQRIYGCKNAIYDTRQSSHTYKLAITSPAKTGLAKRYRDLFYNEHKEKRIPTEIVHASLPVIEAFWNGFYAGDGDKACQQRQPISQRIGQNGKQICTALILLARRLGWRASICSRADKPNHFRMTFQQCTKKSVYRRNPLAVKKQYVVSSHFVGEYVYDLETENHHFHVGPGSLVVHNTDSVMLTHDAAPTHEELYQRLSRDLCDFNRTLPAPMKLVYESTMRSYMQLAKKKYASLLTVRQPDGTWKQCATIYKKGLANVRREYCSYVKQSLDRIIDAIMSGQSSEDVYQLILSVVRPLLAGKVPLDELIMTRENRREEYVSNVPQAVFARKMRARRTPLQSGRRYEFVFIQNDCAPSFGDHWESLDFFRQRKELSLDYRLYADRQLRNEVDRLTKMAFDRKMGTEAIKETAQDMTKS